MPPISPHEPPVVGCVWSEEVLSWVAGATAGGGAADGAAGAAAGVLTGAAGACG